MFRLLRTTSPVDDVTPTEEEVARVTEMLTRTRAGGAYETVLAKRVGQLHARFGSSVYETLAAIDAAYAAAGRPDVSLEVTSVAVDAWAQDVLLLASDGGAESLTGLTRAENLHAHMEQSCSGCRPRPGTPTGDCAGHHVLIAEVLIDERDQRARGALQTLEAELSLALVHAVLEQGVAGSSPWARLGERRMGTAVDLCPDLAETVGDAVQQARRWLSRWRHDLDVAAWIEPVPVEPRERGLLMRDLAM